jgi:hypothetical protein
MLVVATELGVGTLERRVSVGLGLVDTVCAFALVSSISDMSYPPSGVYFIGAVPRSRWSVVGGALRTRSCEPSCSGCAETSSLTLRIISTPSNFCAQRDSTYWPWRRFYRVKGLSVDFVRRGCPELAA